MAVARRSTVNWDMVCADMESSISSAQVHGWRPDVAITRFHYAERLRDREDIAPAREQLSHAIKLFNEMEMTWWLEQGRKLQAQLT